MLAPGSDRIPVELFQILKDDAVESAALNMQYAGSRHALCWSSCEEIPHVQVKSNPSKIASVVRGHQGADTLNHNHRNLANLITSNTALSNSMKLSHAALAHPRQMGHDGEF